MTGVSTICGMPGIAQLLAYECAHGGAQRKQSCRASNCVCLRAGMSSDRLLESPACATERIGAPAPTSRRETRCIAGRRERQVSRTPQRTF